MKSLIDVNRELGTEKQCLDYLEAKRWPGGVACIKCGGVRVGRSDVEMKARRDKKDGTQKGDVIGLRYIYDCLDTQCGHQFTATTGTVFHDSHLPLSTWFMAVALMVNAKKSLSALQLQRDLGLGSYKTAWHLAHRIRKAMEQQPGGLFTGVVEVDETFVGGKYDKRRKRAPWGKQAVAGVLERGKDGEPSKVRAFPIPTTSRAILTGVVRNNVAPDAEMLCTDQAPGYKSVGRGYRHEVVNHIALEYARRTGESLVLVPKILTRSIPEILATPA
jgi:hypothetical protein